MTLLPDPKGLERWKTGEFRCFVRRDWQPANHLISLDERLATVLADTAASLVLAHRPLISRLGAFARETRTRCLDTNKAAVAKGHTKHQAAGATGDDLGSEKNISCSTSTPKGALISRCLVVHCADDCHFGPKKGFLDLVPLAFEATIFWV